MPNEEGASEGQEERKRNTRYREESPSDLKEGRCQKRKEHRKGKTREHAARDIERRVRVFRRKVGAIHGRSIGRVRGKKKQHDISRGESG